MMAMLFRRDEDTYEAWCAWSVELLRRGLRPIDAIEVHGPHPYPGDFIWGEAKCTDMENDYFEVEFNTRRPCRGIWDIHGVTMRAQYGGEKITFPVLKDLPPRWKKLLDATAKKRQILRRQKRSGR